MEFGPRSLDKLNAAAQELRFLLNRGYDVKSASTFIGNHHLLSERQRLALVRITSTDAALAERRRAGRALEVQAELHPSVDGLLSRMENVVTSDAIILDKCKSWYNLNRPLIGSAVPDTWILRLDGLQKEGMSCRS